ncbi:hypothetical protein Pa4123_01650 [Phytohabitans aurantiacus]|uniref:Minor tail T domain-containing protein n=1 Tax=Phytohabitans aurantiacus TaxID=3016789 RepID=A0ABQ5QKX6_9ACTN|nr:hypothetical protein Pa4123_01650 [Phytohabitans aurantiacus]
MAYERIAGPIGPERADMHSAIVASTVANAMRGKKGRPFKPADFLPKWDDPARWTAVDQTEQDHLRLVQQLNKAMGGRTRTRGGDADEHTGGPAGQDRRRQHRRRQGHQANRVEVREDVEPG